MASSGHRPCHLVQHQAELVVRFGVAQRVARELAQVLIVIVPLRQIFPPGSGVSVLSSGRMCSPWRGSSSSRMISGRSRLTT